MMSFRIGEVVIPKSPDERYKVEGYGVGGIAVRGYVSSDAVRKLTVEGLYHLKEGSVVDIEIETDDGKVLTGKYRINELTWRNEQKDDRYELMFNIGLRKQEE
jgi:hypothetical protein